MRSICLAAAAASLAGCTPAAPPAKWRPAPTPGAAEPSDTIKNAPASAWRDVAPENLLIMDLENGERVAIELAPGFAPVHVANIRAFARAGWWNDAAIYRVQDNYVTQWGIGDAEKPMPAGVVETPPAEYDGPIRPMETTALAAPDAYAAEAGWLGGWPVAWNPATGRGGLTHCYGMVGVARDLAPDTGSGSELYAVIGHAPRHLDRNIAVVGRVLEGMQHLTAIPRGTAALGFIEDKAKQVPIAGVRLAADIASAERPAYEVMRTDSDAFAAYLAGRANRGGAFFQVPAGGVDLCNAPVPTRRKGG